MPRTATGRPSVGGHQAGEAAMPIDVDQTESPVPSTQTPAPGAQTTTTRKRALTALILMRVLLVAGVQTPVSCGGRRTSAHLALWISVATDF